MALNPPEADERRGSIALCFQRAAICFVSRLASSSDVIPVNSPIHPDLLNGKSVDFVLEDRGSLRKGTGSLMAVRGTDGYDYVELAFVADQRNYKKWLTQSLVDRLTPHPSGSGFNLVTAEQ